MRKWFGKYVNTQLESERDALQLEVDRIRLELAGVRQENTELRDVVHNVAVKTAAVEIFRPDAETYGSYAWENIETIDIKVIEQALGRYVLPDARP